MPSFKFILGKWRQILLEELSVAEPDLSRFIVVLCRAEEAGNVGSACRAMKTMGITRLCLAACPDFNELKVRTMAVHAADLYAGARRFDSLAEALAGASLSAGLTRRRGERRKSFSLDLESFARTALARPEGDIALVFGNEQSGLNDEELDLCSLAVHIPTSELFPSLNLAQAVQVACYELRRQALAGQAFPSYTPARREAVDASVTRISGRLGELGFFKKNDGADLREFLRDMSERAALSPAELRYLENIMQKTATLASQR
jgi:TrmH family RNA methyltransferase